MSNTKKPVESASIINIRALCERCKSVDNFQIPTKELLPHFGGLYQVSTIHHCKDGKEMVMNIVLDRNFSVRQATVSPFVSEREVDRWSSEKVKDIRFLVKQIKDADKVVSAVFGGKTIVVAGNNRTFVQRMVHILELFSPTKYPRSIEWTEKHVDDKKIIGTPLKYGKEYPGAVIVNMDTNKVINGRSSRYCRIFLEDLITFEPEGMAYAARLKIEMLVEFAKMLIELSKQKEIGPRAVELVKMDVSEDALEVILDIVDGFDSSALKIIKENWL